MAAAARVRHIKLLALHGRYQNAQVCLERLSGLKAGKAAECAAPLKAGKAAECAAPTNVVVSGAAGSAGASGVTSRAELRGYGEDGSPPWAALRLEGPAGTVEVSLHGLDAPHVVEAAINLGSNTSLRRKTRDTALLGPGCATRAWWVKDAPSSLPSSAGGAAGSAARSAAGSPAVASAKGDEEDPAATAILRGVDESLARVEAALLEHRTQGKPFDGVVGFSQGASLASLFCADEIAARWNLHVAVLCSGYELRPGLKYAVRSLHVFSPLDRMVSPQLSAKLARAMRGEACEHQGGHSVPPHWLHEQLYQFLRT
jgi:predicted esterase